MLRLVVAAWFVSGACACATLAALAFWTRLPRLGWSLAGIAGIFAILAWQL